ncbi:MAG: terpene cyclase/mutase family protein [Planctomycetes bacterium]|nr:terpene cyclase/mutase family protein [Planctomycetota bacterium]
MRTTLPNLRAAAIWVCILLITPLSAAPRQERPLSVTRDHFDLRVRLACDRGLMWLASRQNPNGSWNCKIGYKLYEDYHGQDGEHVGVTALAGMAFVGAGHLPNRGKYGRTVARALEFILASTREEDGYITSNGTRMYSHAFATMFLAEIQGCSPRADVREKLKRAVALLVSAQTRDGGWRYQPIPVDADLSVTVSTLQALRAARNTGIAVPTETIDRAVEYVRKCASPYGGFTYQRGDDYTFNDTRVSYALTACGVVALYSAGLYDSKEVRGGLRYLEDHRRRVGWGRYHYFYSHYYASQAFYMADRGDFNQYYVRIKEEILAHQDKTDGAWSDDVGRTYATAMAGIVLQMPCEWLPLFQK